MTTLKEVMGTKGSVIAYNAGFEMNILRKVSKYFLNTKNGRIIG
jgi:hypothetical protein